MPFMLPLSMSRKLDSPVQTQVAISAFNHACSGAYNAWKTDGKPSARRRIFVQTDTGCVLGVELDRADNAHTVKRRIQLALNVPTEESSLTYGDLVLKNDLSSVRNDSPLLLKRNILHRSSSTPCLSPTGKDLQQRDLSGPIEILGCSSHCSRTKQLVNDVVEAIRIGLDPIAVHTGLGGAYYFQNRRGERIAIVKPTDEEPYAPNNPKGFIGKALGQPGLKRSVRVGETGFREAAAYLLDHNHFSNVPLTLLVKITHSMFHVNEVTNSNKKVHDARPRSVSKIASFQQFIPHDFDAGDHGTSSFPVGAVHRIGILDVRIFNTDRHAGNLLVRKLKCGSGKFDGQMELIPIDHGLCLPETLEDPYFEWMYWPQASIPFSEEELDYIAKLDPKKDVEMLQRELPMIREACLRVLVLSTIFLKEAAEFGLCLSEIGEMMTREFRGSEEEPSELEILCMEARRLTAEREAFSFDFCDEEEKEFQFDLDYEENDSLVLKSSPSHHFGFSGNNGGNCLSKLAEDAEEKDNYEEDEEDNSLLVPFSRGHVPLPSISKLSASLKVVALSKRSHHFQCGGRIDRSKSNGHSKLACVNRSAVEQIPSSASFINLADIGDEEWAMFLEKFQELLPGAFADRRRGSASRKQRLGTSCQF